MEEASKKTRGDDNSKPEVSKSRLPEDAAGESSLKKAEERDQWEPPPCLEQHTVRRIFS